MIGIYLSGTGNTKHCVEKLLTLLDGQAVMVPLESKDAARAVAANDEILLAYPTQFSNVPYMVRDFINQNRELWSGKKVFCMTTMGLFSGDGTGCAARLLKKIKAKIAELDHWTDKQETKAAVDNLIRDTLWAELPECYDEISISEYRQRIYEYVYTRYRAAA